jgi:hypothetical protein
MDGPDVEELLQAGPSAVAPRVAETSQAG